MPPLPDVWQFRADNQTTYTFYPHACVSRPWQAMCRFSYDRQQWIVPMYVRPTPRLRRCIAEWEAEHRN